MQGKERNECEGRREEECWEKHVARNMMSSHEEVGILLVGP